MKKILLILCMFLFIYNVKAYENEMFKMEIPENFELVSTTTNTFTWKDKETQDNIVLSFESNTGEAKHNVLEYSEEDLLNYQNYLQEQLNNELADYKINIVVENVKLGKLNNYDAIVYDAKWPTKDIVGYDVYQKGYTVTQNNYVYSLTFSASKELTDETEFYKKGINSIEFKDTTIEPTEDKIEYWKIIVIVGVVFGILGYFVSAKKK